MKEHRSSGVVSGFGVAEQAWPVRHTTSTSARPSRNRNGSVIPMSHWRRVIVAIAVIAAGGTPLSNKAAAANEQWSGSLACAQRQNSGMARCDVLRSLANHATSPTRGSDASTTTRSSPGGFGPGDLKAAYQLNWEVSGSLVAVVDAYDDPAAASDLALYRSLFGLPSCRPTTGCFRKVNQNGKTGPLPDPSASWAVEVSLDLDMVSAACPHCDILLVEAKTPSIQDLAAAVDEAVALGAVAVANSYGVPEWASEGRMASHYTHAGVTITASAGDFGYGTQFPAVVPGVVSIGGTTLSLSASGRATETVWAGTGSGCSEFEPKPSWQTDTGCAARTQNDLSAVADPATGVWIYDSFLTAVSWQVVGGTSVGSAFVAGIAGAAGSNPGAGVASLYEHVASFYDVTTGSNGTCSVSYLCQAQAGYDGPSGLGSPRALRAFEP